VSAQPAGLRRETIPDAFDAGAFAYDRLVGANPGYHKHLWLYAQRMRLRDARLTGVHSETVPGWQRGIVHAFLASRPFQTGSALPGSAVGERG
jgi:hypothetical protein